MKKKLSWLEIYEKGRDFRQGVIKDNLGLMTVAERKEIERELLEHKGGQERQDLFLKNLQKKHVTK